MVILMANVDASAENVNGTIQIGAGDVDTSNHMLERANVGGDVTFDETVTVNVGDNNKGKIIIPESGDAIRAKEEIKDKHKAEFAEGVSNVVNYVKDNNVITKTKNSFDKAGTDFMNGVAQTGEDIKNGFSNLQARFAAVSTSEKPNKVTTEDSYQMN